MLFVTVYRLDRNTPPHRGIATLLLEWNQVAGFKTRPRNRQSFSNFVVSRALVKMSVMLSWVFTYESLRSPEWTRSWRKWYLMSMGWTRWCREGSSEGVIGALLSQRIRVDAAGARSIPDSNVRSHIASFAHSNADVYSASQEDEATVFCFLVVQKITPDPKVKV